MVENKAADWVEGGRAQASGPFSVLKELSFDTGLAIVLDGAGKQFALVQVSDCIGGDKSAAKARATRIAESLNKTESSSTSPTQPTAGQDAMNKPILNGLWRKNPETPEGKYLVKRRDGTVVEWPSFVIGARDPAAPAALLAYANAAEGLGMAPGYVSDIRTLAHEFELYRLDNGEGDPDRGRHREDDPATIAEMKHGRSA